MFRCADVRRKCFWYNIVMKEIVLEFDKLVGEGKALGRAGGKVVFSYGVLPGEKAKIRVLKEKRNFIEGEAVEIISPSKERIEPREDHYLSCSPWQIIKYPYQAESKKKIAQDLYFQTVKETVPVDDFFCAQDIFGYRTKIEYSFTQTQEGLSFAFHKRGAYWQKLTLPEGCALISPKVNAAAIKILNRLRENKITCDKLKSLILRRAGNPEKVIACLFSKDKDLKFSAQGIEELSGFTVAWSNPLSPMSSADEILSKEGEDFLSEEICGMSFDYGFDCFFQNNIRLFETALREIKNYGKDFGNTLDLYCGAGVIGFSLKDRIKKLLSVEISPSCHKWAVINSQKNSLKNTETLLSAGEKLDSSYFDKTETIILDPPRAGLHKNVVKNIMTFLPQRIIYLSCNPITQGRDALFFLEKYKISKSACFDFYPNTPHLESLLIFEKK